MNSLPQTDEPGRLPTSRVVQHYTQLGLQPLPIYPKGTRNSKGEVIDKQINAGAGWYDHLDTLWDDASPDSNVGLQMGRGSLCVVDADDKNVPGTSMRILAWLQGLGILPLMIRTPSGGAHFYFHLDGELSQRRQVFLLKDEVGAGEVRFGLHTYVVAPPSITLSGQYTQHTGDLAERPHITANDLRRLCDPGNPDDVRLTSTASGLSVVQYDPSALPWRVKGILSGQIKSGQRSEHEGGAVLSLINQGWTDTEIHVIFEELAQPGTKYQEKGRYRSDWLQTTINNMRAYAEAHPESKERQRVRKIKAYAESIPWPGRTGSTDRVVFLSHCGIALESGRTAYYASARDLAERAGLTHFTVSKSNYRLVQSGWLDWTKESYGLNPNQFQIRDKNEDDQCSVNAPFPKRCEGMAIYATLNEDVFRHRGLGKSAQEIYNLLLSGSYTITELAEKTGRHRVTISKRLHLMTRVADPLTGEVMVVEQDGKWSAQTPDLGRMAQVVGTSGALQRQKYQHARERELFQERLVRVVQQNPDLAQDEDAEQD